MPTCIQRSMTWSRHERLNCVVIPRVGAKSELHRSFLTSSKTYRPSSIDCKQGLSEPYLKPFNEIKTLLLSANTKPGDSAGSSTRDGAMYGYSLWADNMPTSKPRMQGSRRMPIKEVEARNDIDTAQVSIQYYDG